MNSSLDLASLDNMIKHSKSPAFMNFSYFYLIYCKHEMRSYANRIRLIEFSSESKVSLINEWRGLPSGSVAKTPPSGPGLDP